MARLGEKVVIGNKDYEYVVDHILEEPNNGLIRVRVVEKRIGISSYSFIIPADVWDAAVRGAQLFPTVEKKPGVICEDIIEEHLKQHGYDGLFNDVHGCACDLDDLCPCCDSFAGCQPGYKTRCDCGEHDYHMVESFPGIVFVLKVEGGQPTAEEPKKSEPLVPGDTTADLESALAALMGTLTPDDIAQIKSVSEKGMVVFHHGFGRDLRNEWSLWGDSPLRQYFLGMGIEHSDDMSGIILSFLWRSVHGEPIRLEEQVQFYKDYWKKALGDAES